MEFHKIIVHAGAFHADDVLCVAMAKIANPSVVVERTNQPPDVVPDGVIVADIGRGKYDHHQEDTPVREDGERRDACGLLFEDLKSQIFQTKSEQDLFESNIIRPIEDQDNGKVRNPLSVIISGMNIRKQQGFEQAVRFMQDAIENAREQEKHRIKSQEMVAEAIEKSDGITLILDQGAPWQDQVCQTSLLFVIYPSERGGYNLQAVPVMPGSFDVRIPIHPELQSQLNGCTFIHKGMHLATFESLADAKDAVSVVMNDKIQEESQKYAMCVALRQEADRMFSEKAEIDVQMNRELELLEYQKSMGASVNREMDMIKAENISKSSILQSKINSLESKIPQMNPYLPAEAVDEVRKQGMELLHTKRDSLRIVVNHFAEVSFFMEDRSLKRNSSSLDQSLIKNTNTNANAVLIVQKAISQRDGDTIVLDEDVPWKSLIQKSDIRFVITPYIGDRYILHDVRTGTETVFDSLGVAKAAAKEQG